MQPLRTWKYTIHPSIYLLVYIEESLYKFAIYILVPKQKLTFHCRPAHQQTDHSSLSSPSLQWFGPTCYQSSKDRPRTQQTSYAMIQLYHSKWCSMSKYRQKASIQSYQNKATITRPLFVCSIQHFCKYREFVGIYIYIYIYRWTFYGSNRICGTSCCTALLTRQSKTKYVGICHSEIQSKNFLHANQMHSPFSWMLSYVLIIH